MDAKTLTLSNTGGTDHLPFDAVGIPGFQFIQDPMAYFSRTYHSNMDNLDALSEDDLKQAATIIASFVWNTSQRDERLPRKPSEDEVMAEKVEKKKAAKDFKILNLAGDWNYEVEVPGMQVAGDMIIKKNGALYDVTIISKDEPDEKDEIKGVASENNTLSFDYKTKVQGMNVKIKVNLDFSERRMEGTMKAGMFGTYPMKGARKM